MDLPPVPPGFTALQAAHETDSSELMNMIGVCTAYRDVAQSRGSDLTMTVDLRDPSWVEGHGLEIRFFHKDERHFPKITNTGDIVILYKIRKFTTPRGQTMVSSRATTWVVLEYESVRDSKCTNGSDIKARLPGQPCLPAPSPSVAVLSYAKAILRLDNPNDWQVPLITPRPTDDVSSGQRIQATKERHQKFTLIGEARVPNGAKGIFGDMLCEIRRIWDPNTGDRCELYVTDYTENSDLYDFGNGVAQEGIGHDYGDRFGTEKYKPDKINVQIFKRSTAETDEKFKALLRRKREYEEHCKTEGIAFIRDPRTIRTRNKDEGENGENTTSNSKSKKNRIRKDQKRAKAAAAAVGTSEGATDMITAIKQPPSLALITNAAVRCNNIAIPVTPIATILSSDILQRKTPSGTTYQLPFQNSCYKSRIRVVDYFPHDIQDFCASIRDSDYACLSDCESVSDADLTQDDMPTSVGDDGVKWEWRFILLVEDAKSTPASDGGAKQMELLVCGTDGSFLLREDPCNLRENKMVLAKLKETLFHLWGDLQEQKEELKSKGKEGAELVPKGRPFECFIKEYGVPAKDEMGKEDKDVERMLYGPEVDLELFHHCIPAVKPQTRLPSPYSGDNHTGKSALV
ncbi:hypothetical protein DV737_g3233, partial [Chaetothyriales sp. CBS 132003]